MAITLVNADTGFVTPQEGAASGAGAEFPLMMVAAFLVVLLAGPGPLALDRCLGIENPPTARRAPAAARPSALRASVAGGPPAPGRTPPTTPCPG
ncbi:hypothetical protein [Streptomyces flaveolus]|uniref:hypothetical protein n=1 Tax=Streptomyces flaveolus TaxID=67297 RepID=UPI0036FE011D